MFNEFNEFGNKIELGLGQLRAVAQCYNYSYNKIEFGNNFQKTSKRWGLTLNWGLGRCARRRKFTITVTVTWTWGWGLDGCARWRKVTITVAIQCNWKVIFKGL